MPRRDFTSAIEQAKQALDRDLPASADRRLRARLNGEAPARRVQWLRVALAATAGLVLVVGAQAFFRASGPTAPTILGGFAVAAPSPDLAATGPGDTVVVISGGCTLRDERLASALSVSGPTTLRRLPDGVELVAGTVALDVDHSRPRPSPYRVRVSHGAIEVLGTAFTVTQREGGGQVTLHRGSIRFTGDDGQLRVLTPGESLAWPLPALVQASPEPTPEPTPNPEPTPARPPVKPVTAPVAREPVQPPSTVVVEKAFDAEELLNQIAVLRSRGQYEDAVTALSTALREPHGAGTNERLSFELGAILTRQLKDRPRACTHWRRHLTEYPKGRYEREVTQATVQLACDREP